MRQARLIGDQHQRGAGLGCGAGAGLGAGLRAATGLGIGGGTGARLGAGGGSRHVTSVGVVGAGFCAAAGLGTGDGGALRARAGRGTGGAAGARHGAVDGAWAGFGAGASRRSAVDAGDRAGIGVGGRAGAGGQTGDAAGQGAAHARLPVGVDHGGDPAAQFLQRSADRTGIATEHHVDRIEAGGNGQADGAVQQGLAPVAQQLLGRAEAARRAGGQDHPRNGAAAPGRRRAHALADGDQAVCAGATGSRDKKPSLAGAAVLVPRSRLEPAVRVSVR